jgi:MFS family permease
VQTARRFSRASQIWCPIPLTAEAQKARKQQLLSSAGPHNNDRQSTFSFDSQTGPHDGGSPDRSFAQRVLFLCLTASAGIGGQYAYNIIGAVAPVLHKQPFGVSETHVGLLFCGYSLPNIVMPLLGGLINDHLGVRAASCLFSFVVVVGSAVCWLAVSVEAVDADQRFGVMMLGMAVFGVGSESLYVAQKAMLASWFAESKQFPQLSFAVGCALSFGCAGAIGCRWIVPRMAEPGAECTQGSDAGSVPWHEATDCMEGGDAGTAARQQAVASAFAVSAAVCAGAFLSLLCAAHLHRRDEASMSGSRTNLAGERCTPRPGTQSCLVVTQSGFRSLPGSFFWIVAMLSLATGCDNSFPNFGADVFIEHWCAHHSAAPSRLQHWNTSGLQHWQWVAHD